MKGHIWPFICVALFDYLHMFHINFVNEGNIYEIEPIEILMTLIHPTKVIQCKTKTLVITLVITCTINEILSIENSMTLIWPLNVISGQMLYGKLKDHMTYNTCFIYTLVIVCTIYEIDPIETSMTLIWHWKVNQNQKIFGKLKDHMTKLYVLHINIGHNMHN